MGDCAGGVVRVWWRGEWREGGEGGEFGDAEAGAAVGDELEVGQARKQCQVYFIHPARQPSHAAMPPETAFSYK